MAYTPEQKMKFRQTVDNMGNATEVKWVQQQVVAAALPPPSHAVLRMDAELGRLAEEQEAALVSFWQAKERLHLACRERSELAEKEAGRRR